MYEFTYKGEKYFQTEIEDFIEDSESETKQVNEKDHKSFFAKIFRKAKYIIRRITPSFIRKTLARIMQGKQKTLLQYFSEKVSESIEKIRGGIKRINFKKPLIFLNEEKLNVVLPEDEIIAFNNFQNYNGNINHMFGLNNFSVFEDIALRHNPTLENVNYSLTSLFKAQIMGVKRGYNYNTILWERLQEFYQLQQICGFENNNVPSRRLLSGFFDKVGLDTLYEYYYSLVNECVTCGLIDPRIVVGDGTLILGHTNPFKKDENGNYTDPGCGIYIRKKYIKGVGRLLLTFCCAPYGLPTVFDIRAGNCHESHPIFPLLDEYNKLFGQYPLIFGYDSILDSHIIHFELLLRGILPLINSKVSKTEDQIELSKKYHIRSDYTYFENIVDSKRIANFRTAAERYYSVSKDGYERNRMNNQGDTNAEYYVLLTLITILLTALTAYKVGREDLIYSVKAFSRI